MNFFSREHRLSHLIRSADPLASAPAPQANIPSRLWLALPLLATAALPLLLAQRPPTPPERVPPPLRVARLLPMPSPAPYRALPSEPKRVTSVTKRQPRQSKKIYSKLKRVTSKLFSASSETKISVKPSERITSSSEGAIKSSVAVAKNDLGEAIVISVRPITPDELRQELQTP